MGLKFLSLLPAKHLGLWADFHLREPVYSMTASIITPPTLAEAAAPPTSPALNEPTFLHEFFERAAQRWPQRIAIDVPPSPRRPARRLVSYAELERQANALAHFLADAVDGKDCVAVILLPRDSEYIYSSQLAVLKAGAAYTCIDPAFPDEQVCAILADADAAAVLTDAAGAARLQRLEPTAANVLNVLAWCDFEGCGEPLEPPPWLEPDSLAYLIYTSGTTGRPKGVMIEHRSIVNLVKGDLQTLAVQPEDRVGQNSSAAYDSSVEEIWSALAAGATLVVMDDETTRLGPDLVAWLREEAVTMFSPPPTLLRAAGCDDPEHELPALRLLQVGGEALPQDLAHRWARGRCLLNDYGPTECTVTALRARIRTSDPITIGRPVPGLRAWVLNESLQEVDEGEAGELCLGGVALARGYRNQPELTATKFPHHPLLGRIYRTGDLVSRNPEGTFCFHGRIDAQVKVRGYRIELEAIESCLMQCGGVLQAACRVQNAGGQQRLVAFVAARDPAIPPSTDALKSELRRVLPSYMVPSHIGLLARLPTTTSGKLDRKNLPILDTHGLEEPAAGIAPRNPMEEKLLLALHKTLGRQKSVSVHHDFFNDLGGDSLQAALFVSRLREDPLTASLTVRDVYEARTIAELAQRIDLASAAGPVVSAHPRERARDEGRPAGSPILATLVQMLWLLLGFILGGPIAYLLALEALPQFLRGLGLAPFLLVAPLLYSAGLALYTSLMVVLAVLAKKLLIGRYRPLRAPVWGSFYVRNWMVQQIVHLIPWRRLEGSVFELMVLRALGARIGRRVHLHRGVNLLQGGWDLLDIGDDVAIGRDASLQLVDLEDGQIVVAPIALGEGATLDVRAGVGGHGCLEAESYLTAMSFLPRGGRVPRGERWDGIPARPAGPAPARPSLADTQRQLSPLLHGLALILARNLLGFAEALPAFLLTLAFALGLGIDSETVTAWAVQPTLSWQGFLLGAALVVLTMPLTLIFQAFLMRALGRVTPGVVSRWSLAYLRVWLKMELVESANHWLTGSLFWPHWLRWAGMKTGRGCEISTIVDTIPELVEVGPGSFLADYIYLGCPRIHRGTVTLAPVRLGRNTYFGNNALIAGGQTIPDDVLLGVNTVADDRQLRAESSWFGHPPFELPRREIVTCARRATHTPNGVRYVNRLFWELLRFALPLAPLLIVLAWFRFLAAAEETVSLPILVFGVVPVLDLGVVAALCLLSPVLKWTLLGRVRPAVHPLWSCWCRRWEFHYVAHDLYTAGPLAVLEGTLLLNWYLRAMGARIGRHVALGSGYAGVIDHDMLAFEDGATVSCLFQAHTFEDRVLKIDRVTIRRQATVGLSAVLLYGADIGVRTHVMAHSVVMKHERLLSGCCYAGCPTQRLSHKPALLRADPRE